MEDVICWITGATSGIGAALADTMPWVGTRVINISRRRHPTLESVQADLSDTAGWDIVDAHLAGELAGFRGKQAIFIHNAFLDEPAGYVGAVDGAAYRRQVLANAAAPLVLGETFLRHVPKDVTAGLVMISSAAARVPYAGRAAYGGSKAAMEQWVRTVRLELAETRPTSWAVAIRPGAVDTPSLRRDSEAPGNPTGPALRAALADGTIDSPNVAAQRIWAELPPGPDTPAVILLGTMVPPPR